MDSDIMLQECFGKVGKSYGYTRVTADFIDYNDFKVTWRATGSGRTECRSVGWSDRPGHPDPGMRVMRVKPGGKDGNIDDTMRPRQGHPSW
ncbi:MAG: hypothetical protein MJZ68_07840 [archaeon]|nr:hypothetical protein [archaeon]